MNAVYNYLNNNAIGAYNAIHMKDLAVILDLSEREVRRQKYQANNTVGKAMIVSSEFGYYMASNENEALTLYQRTLRDGLKKLQQAQKIKTTFQLNDQVAFDLDKATTHVQETIKKAEDSKVFWTKEDIAKRYKRSLQSIWRDMKKGMPYHKIGTTVRFDPIVVERWYRDA